MTVNREEYAVAVTKMVELARGGTGGGRVAAQVVLSAYNGWDYQLDVADMGNLDRINHAAAMRVIQGRYDTGCEPHSVIEDGERVFHGLKKQYRSLHVYERSKEDCPTCDGRGLVYKNYDDEDGTPCTRCDGLGRVCRCNA